MNRQCTKTLLHYFIIQTATKHLKIKDSGFIWYETHFVNFIYTTQNHKSQDLSGFYNRHPLSLHPRFKWGKSSSQKALFLPGFIKNNVKWSKASQGRRWGRGEKKRRGSVTHCSNQLKSHRHRTSRWENGVVHVYIDTFWHILLSQGVTITNTTIHEPMWGFISILH